MNPSAQAVNICLQANLPFVLWSDPGKGKDGFLKAIVTALDLLPYCTLSLNDSDPADIGGLCILSGEWVRRVPVGIVRELFEAKKGTLYLEELTTSPLSCMAAALKITHPEPPRRIGDQVLPEEVRIAASANDPGVAASGRDLPAPSANRVVHIPWEPTPDEWISGTLQGWPAMHPPQLPEQWWENFRMPAAL